MSGTTPGVFISPNGKKTFIPLENNPSVFTDLVHRLGVSPALGFYDVWSISEPALLAHIPQPAHALIFIAPAHIYHSLRGADMASGAITTQKGLRTYDGRGASEPVMWFQQTIGHACGLIALLHSVANGPARAYIRPGTLLAELVATGEPLGPAARAQMLYDSVALEQAHMASAVVGDTLPPSSAEPNGYHFISFVKGKDGALYELEGAWDGPICRGFLGDEEDMLSPKALELGVGRFLQAAEGSLEFSIVALATRAAGEDATAASA